MMKGINKHDASKMDKVRAPSFKQERDEVRHLRGS